MVPLLRRNVSRQDLRETAVVDSLSLRYLYQKDVFTVGRQSRHLGLRSERRQPTNYPFFPPAHPGLVTKSEHRREGRTASVAPAASGVSGITGPRD